MMRDQPSGAATVVDPLDSQSAGARHRAVWWACSIASVAIILGYLFYLNEHVPAILRADFIWELWLALPAVESGDISGILAFVFWLNAGHVLAYQRVLSIINWAAFDYSGEFAKFLVLATYAACWAALAYAVMRTAPRRKEAGIILFIGTLILCTPIYWYAIVWPDGTVSYWSSWIALFFGLPTIVKLMSRQQPPSALGWLAIAVIALAIIVTNGSGWAILPTLLVVHLSGRGYLDRIFASPSNQAMALLALLAIVIGMGAALVTLGWFARSVASMFNTGVIYDSVSRLLDNPSAAVSYFFALLAAPVSDLPVERARWIGVALFGVWAGFVLYILYTRRARELTFWLAVSAFGLGGGVLNAIGRWHLVLARGDAMVPSHYGIFVTPFLIGLAAVSVAVLARERFPIAAKVALAALGIPALMVLAYYYVHAAGTGSKLLKAEREWHLAARFGAQNHHAIHMIRFSGDSAYHRIFALELLPYFKEHGKYSVMTEGFVDDPAQFLKEQGVSLAQAEEPSSSGEACVPGSAPLMHISQDDRYPHWSFGNEPELNLVWTYGYALRSDCTSPADYVFMVDAGGDPLCVSRPGPPMLWDIPEADKARLSTYAEAVFNFSCPIHGAFEAQAPYTVYSWSEDDRRLVRLGTSAHRGD